ncbi:unnamed protein product [Ophioblennius macclurei]
MTKTNRCLRGIFLAFNGLFAGLGVLLIYGTVKATAFSSEFASMGGPSMAWIWVFSIGVLVISCLGVYAGKTEKILLLKIFAGFMVAGMIIMMILGIVMAVGKNKIAEAFASPSDEIVQHAMTDPSMRQNLNELQLNGHCCGIWQPSDWGNEIPESCNCNYKTEGLAVLGFSRAQCTAKPAGFNGPTRIYGQPCSEVIVLLCNMVFNAGMGFCFGLAVIALLGLLISGLMIHQVKRYEGMGTVGMPMKGF